jgi:hypothetical protein
MKPGKHVEMRAAMVRRTVTEINFSPGIEVLEADIEMSS